MPLSHPNAIWSCAIAVLACAAPAAVAQTPTETPAADPAMVESPFFKIGWPKVQMPKIDWKPSFGGDSSGTSDTPRENPVSKALDKVAATSRRASDGVRNAWGSAVGKLSGLTGGGEPSRQTAKNDEPGFWSRLFTPEPPRAPETMSEWIAQDRIGTTTR